MRYYAYLSNKVDFVNGSRPSLFVDDQPMNLDSVLDWPFVGIIDLDIDKAALIPEAIEQIEQTERELKLQHAQKLEQLAEQKAKLLSLEHVE